MSWQGATWQDCSWEEVGSQRGPICTVEPPYRKRDTKAGGGGLKRGLHSKRDPPRKKLKRKKS